MKYTIVAGDGCGSHWAKVFPAGTTNFLYGELLVQHVPFNRDYVNAEPGRAAGEIASLAGQLTAVVHTVIMMHDLAMIQSSEVRQYVFNWILGKVHSQYPGSIDTEFH